MDPADRNPVNPLDRYVPVKSVTVSYPENAPANYTPAVYIETSFENAISRLIQLAHVARKSRIYHADVVVEWTDGYIHRMKYPVGQPLTAGLLREKVWRYFAFYAGLYCPPGMPMKFHRTILPAVQRQKYARLLATHETS